MKLHYVSAAHSQVSNNGQPLSQTQPSPFLSLSPVHLFLRPFRSRITPSRSDSIQSARGSGIVTQLGHAPQRCVPSPSATGRLGNSGKGGRGAARQRQRFQAASRQTKRRPNQPKTSRGGRTDLTWAVAGANKPNWLQLPSGLRMTSPLDCVSCNCKSQHRVHLSTVTRCDNVALEADCGNRCRWQLVVQQCVDSTINYSGST